MEINQEEISWISSGHAIVQPHDGSTPVRELIDGAKRTILLKMFTFTIDDIAESLIAAQKRGVDVRVMLNPARSSGSRANDDMRARLHDGGITVAWSSPAFAVTHEKSMVVDGRTAMIATFNYGEKYFTATRDYGILTEDTGVVAEIEEGFHADWERREFAPRPPARCSGAIAIHGCLMCAFIDQAKHTLDVQHPKFVDAMVLDRLDQANERGAFVCA